MGYVRSQKPQGGPPENRPRRRHDRRTPHATHLHEQQKALAARLRAGMVVSMDEKQLQKIIDQASTPNRDIALADKLMKLGSEYSESTVISVGGGYDKETEKRRLRAISSTPIVRLLVEQTAQQMVADGVSSQKTADTRSMWEPWEKNGLPSAQTSLYAAALTYGEAYAVVLPGLDAPQASIRCYSPKMVTVHYEDMAGDEWPQWAAICLGDRYKIFTSDTAYDVTLDKGRIAAISATPHSVGVCPVIRYAPNADLEGVSVGEPIRWRIPAERFAKTVSDRLLAQHYNSWKVRTVTGLDRPETDSEALEQKAKLSNDTILTGGEGVQFGTLDETPLDGFLKAEAADLATIAALAQKPVWALSGSQLVNLSADAIAEARSSERQKIQALQRALGRSHCQLLRLAAHIEGRAADAADFSLRITWQDTEARSLSQSADALGKIASQLQVPAQKLWDMIPGVSKDTADQWREYAEAHPTSEAALTDYLRSTALTDTGANG
nr:MAG TPA: PORTAL PROTEIN [Caudoviricetes sp.]